jgi:pimeloyl-ACP methyl ester carboxylesterase
MTSAMRPLRMSPTTSILFNTDDDAELRLIRYHGGAKGPVALAPGFGTSTLAFSTTTVETNLPELLFEAGYDVFLFDYRSSPDLPVSSTQYTLDDIIAKDWPAAIDRIIAESGAADVQVVAHCVGSGTVLTSLMMGLQNVRSVVASQFTPYVDFSTKTQLKAGTHLPSVLNVMGVEGLDPDCTEKNWEQALADKILEHYPTWERCDLATCRRILFLYGEVFKHSQLNDDTHLQVHSMFGNATMTAFEHLSRIIVSRRMVNRLGEDVYLRNLGEIKCPVGFIHGEENRFILPSGSARTFAELQKLNGPERYTRHLIPGYAHMDCFIGKNAHRDVFPTILGELEKFN